MFTHVGGTHMAVFYSRNEQRIANQLHLADISSKRVIYFGDDATYPTWETFLLGAFLHLILSFILPLSWDRKSSHINCFYTKNIGQLRVMLANRASKRNIMYITYHKFLSKLRDVKK